MQSRHQHLLYVGLKDSSAGRPFYGQRWPHPLDRHARKQRSVLAPAPGYRHIQALPSGCVAVERGANEVCVPHSSTNSSPSLAPPPRLPSPSRPPARTRYARWRVVPLFARGADASYGTAHGGATHRESCDGLYVLATLPKGEVGTFLQIGAKEPSCLLVENRSRSWALLRS